VNKGIPAGFVKFPGGYSNADPGKTSLSFKRDRKLYFMSINAYYRCVGIILPDGMHQFVGLSKYVPPGPPVWTG